MSQTYVVGCEASVCEVKKAKDSVVTKLVLTQIVEEAEQKEILSEILKKRGFEEIEGSEGQVLTKTEEGLLQIVDLEDMTVTTTAEKEEKIERKKATAPSRFGKDDRDQGYDKATEERLNEEFRAQEQAKLEKSIAITEAERSRMETKLLKEISAKLEATKEARTEEINDIVKDVYTESLKKKASRMGNITSVKESKDEQGNYEMRIKLTADD